MRFAIFFLLYCFLPYCQPVFALNPSDTDQTLDFPTVVQISAPDRDDEGEIVNAYCVGTFISPAVLVTAAHCVRGAVLLGQKKINITSGYYREKEFADGVKRVIGYYPENQGEFDFEVEFARDLKKQIKERGWKSVIQPEQDFAIIKLTAPFPWLEQQRFPSIFTKFDLNKIDLKNYWPTVVTINPIAEIRTLNYKRKAQLNKISKSFRGYWESQSTTRVEPGDSGAPLFMRSGDSWYLVGVTKGRGENFFSNWDVFVPLNEKACFASQAFTQGDVSRLFCP